MQRIIWLLVVLTATGCAAKKVYFESADKAKVNIIDGKDAGSEGRFVGETPIQLPLEQVENKTVRITYQGAIPQYWYFPRSKGDEIRLKIALRPLPVTDDSGKESSKPDKDKDKNNKKDQDKSVRTMNLTHRLLLKSYQALAGNQANEARKLAEELAQLEPLIAAPHIIIGLTYIQQGDKASAQASLKKASVLDPTDRDIDELLKIVQ